MSVPRLIVFLYFISSLAFGEPPDNFEALFGEGQTYLRQGQYYLALDDLQSAQALAITPEQQAKASGFLGLTHYRMRHYQQAEVFLRQAIALDAGDAKDRAGWTATLAELRGNQRQTEEARRLYAKALQFAGNDQKLAIGIRLGQAALLKPDKQLTELLAIRDSITTLNDTAERSHYLLNLGIQAQRLELTGLKLAYESFEQARRDAGTQQPRIAAESLNNLAQLYENQKRDSEALSLNRQGILAAQSIAADDLLLDLKWRQGRLYRHQQRIPEALAAYQQAVGHIEAIRQDIPVEYHDGRSSYRETLEPLYLGLADLLLIEARQQSGENKSALLRRARATVELIKQSELEDYLGGRCAVQNNKSTLLETVEPATAVIYPIVLPDRLELLVSNGNEIHQYSEPVDAGTLQNLARHLAGSLRRGDADTKIVAEQFYHWLIGPADAWLRQRRVQTLVIVPDGVLRLIPPAALFDGEHYLIENYALGISPGLTLFEPSPLQQRGLKALLAGMSEPGSVVEHLPPDFLNAITDIEERGIDAHSRPPSRALALSLKKTSGDALPQTRQPESVRWVKDPVFRQKLKAQLSLPGVAQEIHDLHKQIANNTLLINESFTVAEFNHQAIQEPYSIIHIASHGVFGNTADTSFLMAYDDVINIDELERLLKADKFSKQPIELLTLSACQTAEGDDRAPLGFSGIALKAKVRSALGTLWPVSDEAASLLMVEFYKALSQPGVSKAQALRQAQLLLLKQKKLENPFYWSPFILVGNWL